MNHFKPGDRVGYNGTDFAGTVKQVDHNLAYVLWDGDTQTLSANRHRLYFLPSTQQEQFQGGDLVHSTKDATDFSTKGHKCRCEIVDLLKNGCTCGGE